MYRPLYIKNLETAVGVNKNKKNSRIKDFKRIFSFMKSVFRLMFENKNRLADGLREAIFRRNILK